MATTFGNLYDYNGDKGVIIPQTSDIKTTIETAFKAIFGNDFSTAAETPNGRLIEAMTLLFTDVVKVNAQNAERINPDKAVGAYLHFLAALFGVTIDDNDSDETIRNNIKTSGSRGSGYEASIRNAILKADSNAKNVVVLENGTEDPKELPIDEYGNSLPNSIFIDPHSVFISIGGSELNNENIATAIRATKSVGCSFVRNSEYGAVQTATVTDSDTSYAFNAYYYSPTQLYAQITVTISNAAYGGSNIETDTKTAVVAYFAQYTSNHTATLDTITAAVAALGSGIIVKGVSFQSTTTDPESDDFSWDSITASSQLVIMPYQYVEIATTDVVVNLG